MSNQTRLLLSGLACTVLLSLYYSQQGIHCSQLLQISDAELYNEHFVPVNAERYDKRHAEQPFSAVPRERVIKKEPYKCGVLFFYHIPSTGGSSSELVYI
jgi:hypothetical protein